MRTCRYAMIATPLSEWVPFLVRDGFVQKDDGKKPLFSKADTEVVQAIARNINGRGFPSENFINTLNSGEYVEEGRQLTRIYLQTTGSPLDLIGTDCQTTGKVSNKVPKQEDGFTS